MLSRVAESVYWLNRYIERADNVARFVDVNFHLHLDLPSANGEQWEPLVRTTGDYDVFMATYGAVTRENALQFLAFDLNNPNSIASCLRSARENARIIREIIPSEIWEHINTFHIMVRDAARIPNIVYSPHDFLARVRSDSNLAIGLTESAMPRGEVWHFARLGRYLERADKTLRILDVKTFLELPSIVDIGDAIDAIQWSALLRSASAFEAYRKRHGRIEPDRVAQFLLLDREFPRAVLFCVNAVDESLHAISRTPEDGYSNRAEQRVGLLTSELAYADIQTIIAAGLHEYLDALQAKLNVVGDAVFDTYFALHPISAANS
ncbi:MAG TPA: alpha-E domain-containing protein [Candidatus Hydrogenedentes bacterium]|nr:alpha-E domain-containing protein [Candidatus Hydrogenedentota bacterium]HRK33243.1 alpha-E domain-containing protein [Candidatus Hydrogenedentota bacterium]